MKIKIFAIVLLIFFTCGLNPVIGDIGGGGGGEPIGNCPCYYVGQFVCDYGYWQLGHYYYIVETYIGNCQIRSDWYDNGHWFQYVVNAGGCTCQCGAIPD